MGIGPCLMRSASVGPSTSSRTSALTPSASSGPERVQCESLRLTRVRGVPLIEAAVGFGKLVPTYVAVKSLVPAFGPNE